MINALLSSLIEYINVPKDHDSEELVSSKRKLITALNQFIDFRVEALFDSRRRKASKDRIATADSINSALKSATSSVKSLTALSSAPKPPDNRDIESLQSWLKIYEDWYNNQREHGMLIS